MNALMRNNANYQKEAKVSTPMAEKGRRRVSETGHSDIKPQDFSWLFANTNSQQMNSTETLENTGINTHEIANVNTQSINNSNPKHRDPSASPMNSIISLSASSVSATHSRMNSTTLNSSSPVLLHINPPKEQRNQFISFGEESVREKGQHEHEIKTLEEKLKALELQMRSFNSSSTEKTATLESHIRDFEMETAKLKENQKFLQEELNDAHKKNQLKVDIIKEKDAYIQELQASILKMKRESSVEIDNMKCSLLAQETILHQLQFKYEAELQSKSEQLNQLKNELSSAKAEKMMILEAKGAHQTLTQMKEEWFQEKRSFIENVEKEQSELSIRKQDLNLRALQMSSEEKQLSSKKIAQDMEYKKLMNSLEKQMHQQGLEKMELMQQTLTNQQTKQELSALKDELRVEQQQLKKWGEQVELKWKEANEKNKISEQDKASAQFMYDRAIMLTEKLDSRIGFVEMSERNAELLQKFVNEERYKLAHERLTQNFPSKTYSKLCGKERIDLEAFERKVRIGTGRRKFESKPLEETDGVQDQNQHIRLPLDLSRKYEKLVMRINI